jgi:hypothetical protein
VVTFSCGQPKAELLDGLTLRPLGHGSKGEGCHGWLTQTDNIYSTQKCLFHKRDLISIVEYLYFVKIIVPSLE